MILICLPFFVTAITAVIVVVASIRPGDTPAIVAVELAARASFDAIFFVALVLAVVVAIASPVEAELLKVNVDQENSNSGCHQTNILFEIWFLASFHTCIDTRVILN